MTNKFFIIESLFTELEINSFSHNILQNYKSELRIEDDSKFYVDNCWGGSPKYSWNILSRLTPKIESVIGKKVTPVNPFCRIYFNNSYLNKHVDRDDLEWTLTVCLGNNLKKDWPLFIEIDDEVISLPNKVGVSYLIEGTKVNHWREKLICSEDEYSIHMFLHWRNHLP